MLSLWGVDTQYEVLRKDARADIEAGMAAFEARVAALNSQIEAVTAEQRP